MMEAVKRWLRTMAGGLRRDPWFLMAVAVLFICFAALGGCASKPQVVEQTLLQCPAAPPDIDCDAFSAKREGVVEQVVHDLWLRGNCYRRKTEVWRETWEGCVKTKGRLPRWDSR